MKLKNISNPQSPSDDIFNIVVQVCEFFKDQNGEMYLIMSGGNGYMLQYLSRTTETKSFFRKLYFNTYNKMVKNAEVLTAYDTICSLVDTCTDIVPVFTRVAQNEATIFYDLVSTRDDVVMIDKTGVSVVNAGSIKDLYFYRDSSMKEQQKPIDSGYGLIDFVEEVFNISQEQCLLFVVYICASFVPEISHPILIVEGEKGSGKTTLLKKLLDIINPVCKDVFILSRNTDNLITALSNNYFSVFDNVGTLSDEVSNILCQASTGGTLVKRKLYSDNTALSVNIKRLVALNGINLEISQSDLLDRAILIRLERITDSKRCSDKVINERFDEVLPSVLANIFSILSRALRLYSEKTLEERPRMADFCEYGYAIAEAIFKGYGVKFIEQYKQNIKFATESAIEENPLLECIRYIADEGYWYGTASELLLKLKGLLPKVYIGRNLPENFPKSANALSRKLNLHQHELKNMGIKINIGRAKERFIAISKEDKLLPSVSTIPTINLENIKM